MSRHTENTMKEIFKPIPGYEHGYEVSNLGRVKSLKRGKEKLLKPGLISGGYYHVILFKDGKGKTHKVHRLVMLAFIGESDLDVNHINGIKTDNRLENLEYCTASENTQHAYDTGLKTGLKGERNPSSKLTKACVERIKYGHQGMTQQAIAKIYDIDRSLVGYIRQGKLWSHI